MTKKMAEDLTAYLEGVGIKVRYMHHDIDTVERMEIIRDLRLGEFDVLVGINLLREGLDIPEVSLVAILDADKEGFLRSETSLVQTIGRAARNAEGQVIMYADEVTPSMERAIAETERRRGIQLAYNKEHGIVPVSYTHLDVYKRQPLWNMSTTRTPCSPTWMRTRTGGWRRRATSRRILTSAIIFAGMSGSDEQKNCKK